MREFEVLADWTENREQIGRCRIDSLRGRETISFSFDADWICCHPALVLDPDLSLSERNKFIGQGYTCGAANGRIA